MDNVPSFDQQVREGGQVLSRAEALYSTLMPKGSPLFKVLAPAIQAYWVEQAVSSHARTLASTRNSPITLNAMAVLDALAEGGA